MLFIRHTHATSCISSSPSGKLNKITIELMTFALTCYANISFGCSVNPTFFVRSLPFFLILSVILKNKKNCMWEGFNYFSCTIHIGSNWYMDTGVHDLEVAFFKANSN